MLISSAPVFNRFRSACGGKSKYSFSGVHLGLQGLGRAPYFLNKDLLGAKALLSNSKFAGVSNPEGELILTIFRNSKGTMKHFRVGLWKLNKCKVEKYTGWELIAYSARLGPDNNSTMQKCHATHLTKKEKKKKSPQGYPHLSLSTNILNYILKILTILTQRGRKKIMAIEEIQQ